MIQFTQSDTADLLMTAVDGDAVPVNITGASFSTEIKGPNGALVTIPNSQHSITSAVDGEFTISLTADNTTDCGVGENKDIITTIIIGASIVHFRGIGILTVYPPDPQQ